MRIVGSIGRIDQMRLRTGKLTDEEFDRLLDTDGLLEWAEVYPGRRYGTPREAVEAAREAGRDVVVEIDVQGAAQVRASSCDTVSTGQGRRRITFSATEPITTRVTMIPGTVCPAGEVPTVEQAVTRLDHLRAHGPTPDAFTFKTAFDPAG